MRLLPALMIFLALPALAGQVYRWTDAQGKVHFSDQPAPPGAKSAVEKSYKSGSAQGTPAPKASITLYATATCGAYCDQAKAYLAKRGVTFTSKDPATDVAANEALRAGGATPRVPTLMIDGDKLEGFSESAWDYALNKAGYPKANAPSNTP